MNGVPSKILTYMRFTEATPRISSIRGAADGIRNQSKSRAGSIQHLHVLLRMVNGCRWLSEANSKIQRMISSTRRARCIPLVMAGDDKVSVFKAQREV
jgi:hypothetical protein